jgi:hypothetical protein
MEPIPASTGITAVQTDSAPRVRRLTRRRPRRRRRLHRPRRLPSPPPPPPPSPQQQQQHDAAVAQCVRSDPEYPLAQEEIQNMGAYNAMGQIEGHCRYVTPW